MSTSITVTVTAGTCAYCGHYGDTIPASLQPGSTLRQCAGRRACAARIDEASDATAPRA